MTQWAVLSRQDCSLCERMLEELAVALGPEQASRVEVIDIGGNPDLERQYGSRIPVLTADGDFVCNYNLDRVRLAAYGVGTG